MPLSFHLEWSQPLAPGLGGFALARESGWLCAWDAQSWMYLLNHQGQRQGQVRFPQPLACAALADDGCCLLAAGQQGKLRCYSPDLSTLWESEHKAGLLSVALDPLGEIAAVADRKGGLTLLDRAGKKIAATQSPRPLLHLAFVPTVKRVIGAADFGLVAAFDHAAQILWRETPVVHVGGVAVDATGDKILLACFSEGVAWFDGDGKQRKNLATPAPCGKVCQSFSGDVILAGGFGNQVMVLSGQGDLLGQHQLAHTIQAMALDPLAREFYAALSDGTVVKYRLEGLSK